MNAMPYKAAVIVQDDCLHAELLSCVDVNSVSLLSRPQGQSQLASSSCKGRLGNRSGTWAGRPPKRL